MSAKQLFKHAWRSCGIWVGSYGWLLGMSTCPCCGHAGCPVSPLGAGVLAIFSAVACTFLGRRGRQEARTQQSACRCSNEASSQHIEAPEGVRPEGHPPLPERQAMECGCHRLSSESSNEAVE
jgi:hypothetical protein